MYLGALELDVLLGDIRSLADKRSTVEPVLSELQRFGVSAAETGERDRFRRSLFGIAAVGSDVDGLHDKLDECERHVAERHDLELLAVRRRIFGPED
ncbi:MULTISPECIES: DUF503 domain-containing protein [Nocardiaceae]|uniref:DUF503 domain-containing protein n=1 Tax=Nocardiaceae TaxID=85025 RepID=UPI0003623389|nr:MULTISPECIES: DUF503 domain-containing protein [Rhodococcus]OZC45038.1 DUF503 domain-containing protein [Rhodococcus sp. RS1C4]OZC54160.1 DUF503 domain-containing protein [Rhodococcus sp. 06-621-2]OZC89556.1 DUF503 domain-containing protein [Rhodococcus sp. 06-418-1B]OZD05735.1 DUF503 domain-containing protein [Rhodococcus sp. 06-156-4C]OZD16849.1 DUF503 domain-containing protein [Rhodococcus sp. 06-156-4a]